MSTSTLEPIQKNPAKPDIKNRISGFLSLAVAFEMNPSLRDLSEEELFELFISNELAEEWSARGRGES